MSEVFARLSTTTPPALEMVHQSGRVLMTLPVQRAQDKHRNYVISTWVRSYEPVARRVMRSSVYNAGESSVAERMWHKSSVVVSPDDDYTIHAWVCGDPGKLYHCYVIPDLRRKGVVGALIGGVCGPILEYARPWPFPMERGGWTWNPYILVNQ